MKQTIASRLRVTVCAATAALCALAGVAGADETEIFVGQPTTVTSQRPNILFIMDTSGSMDTPVVTQLPFDPAINYSGDCDDDRIYYESGSNPDPSDVADDCDDDNSFPRTTFKCNAATLPLATDGFYIATRAAQWRSSSGSTRWRNINNDGSTQWVECIADAGVHGDGVNLTRLWATNTSGPWTANSANAIGWNSNGADRSYVFYSANYLNWVDGGGSTSQTRLEIMQDVATTTLAQLAVSNSVNVGLMRFSRNSEGGMVLREMNSAAVNGPLMSADIAALDADGFTPLSESMYEAYLYLSGGSVRYGLNSTPVRSVATSRQAANQSLYQSPLTTSCQQNFIVLLTDGFPTQDNSADAAIEQLIGGNCAGSGAGRCLEEIAEYMYEDDQGPADLRPTLAGDQNVRTFTIGFDLSGSEGAAAVAKLRTTAINAGGTFYEANDTATLANAFTAIVLEALTYSTSFTAPAVSVNAFNRTQNLNDLYVTVFKPSASYTWSGNIKKYRLDPDGTIMDDSTPPAPAVDISTGFFRTGARSFWSEVVDGDDVQLGGAANELPVPAQRNIYSDLNGAAALTDASNAVAVANTALITEATLGLGAGEVPGRDALINWMRGLDVSDADGDSDTTDTRFAMGDPMNGRPATVIYGGSVGSPDPNDGVVYAVTNEGYLHAINAVTGQELWAFVPRQMLARARDLYANEAVTSRTYGLDGNVRVIKNDDNDNGVLEPQLGEKVMIYFGMRRGGGEYYGLDVTDRNAPTLLFKIGPNETGARRLTGGGQSWSTPTVARVNVNGATQNALQQVLVFGGGYDTVQDNGPYATDAAGNQIFMVDAVSGNLLWYAGPTTDTAADLRHVSLTHGIPGDVRAFDLTGDGFADRMYAADMGGRVWRFDIHNGQPRDTLVTGGVFASLGNAHLATHPDATTRRFYSAPDASFLSAGGRTWINLAIGSGYRAHPLNVDMQDRFYSLRDHRPFARLTQAQYDASTVITEADVNLIDITTDIAPTIPPGASGWRLDLRRPAASPAAWTGEKSLAEARTVQSMIQFTTYEPVTAAASSTTTCSPNPGQNRLYTVSAFTGAPVLDRENPTDPPDSADDRDTELSQGGIAPEVVWLFPSPENNTGLDPNGDYDGDGIPNGSDTDDDGDGIPDDDDPTTCVGPECRPPPQCLVGLENCGVGLNLDPVRTFWRQTGVN